MMINDIVKLYYNLEIKTINETDGGLTNFNYFIIDNKNKQYFLKNYRNNSFQLINQEIEFIDCAIRNKIKTPKVIKNIKNENISIHDGSYYVLFEYIKGKQPIATNDNIQKIAYIIANIHNINSDCSVKKKKYSLNLNHIISELKKYNKYIKQEIYEFLFDLIQISKKIPFEKLPKSYNHCDIFLDNLIQTEHDLYIIDFEEVSYENVLFDISRCAYGCCIKNDVIDFNKYSLLIQTYDKKRTLSLQEKEYLYEYTIYTGLISIFWRYMEFNIYRKDAIKKELYKELFITIKNFLKIDKLDFYNKIFNKT